MMLLGEFEFSTKYVLGEFESKTLNMFFQLARFWQEEPGSCSEGLIFLS
jgi:hypothetical protein